VLVKTASKQTVISMFAKKSFDRVCMHAFQGYSEMHVASQEQQSDNKRAHTLN
jgi:hypothetical protein